MKLMRCALLFVGCAIQAWAFAAGPAEMRAGVLVDPQGLTLYTYDHDGRYSACIDRCAEVWPPYLVSSEAHAEGDFSVIMRDDGDHQWAYKGKPLYRWKGDVKAGDVTGDAVNGVWHVVK